MMAFSPENPKWDQNPKFAPLSETTSIPTPFILGVPPPPGADWRVPSKDTRNNYGFSRTLLLLFLKWRIAHFLATTKTTEVISFRRQLKTDLASHPLHYFTNNSLVHLVTKCNWNFKFNPSGLIYRDIRWPQGAGTGLFFLWCSSASVSYELLSSFWLQSNFVLRTLA